MIKIILNVALIVCALIILFALFFNDLFPDNHFMHVNKFLLSATYLLIGVIICVKYYHERLKHKKEIKK